jgi:hypothetical protein
LTFDSKQIVSLAWAADGRSLVVSSTPYGPKSETRAEEVWRPSRD